MRRIPLFLSVVLVVFASCKQVDIFEKSVSVPNHAWSSNFKPVFSFHISDTAASYRLFFTIRHEDRYHFNNIYINISNREPGSDSILSARLDLPLATNDQGWLGSGMDDIFEQRVPLSQDNQPLRFHRPGDYSFTVEQVMREDPLQYVLDVGLRLEKIR